MNENASNQYTAKELADRQETRSWLLLEKYDYFLKSGLFDSNDRANPDIKLVDKDLFTKFVEVNGHPDKERISQLENIIDTNFPSNKHELAKVIEQLKNMPSGEPNKPFKGVTRRFFREYLVHLAGFDGQNVAISYFAAFLADRYKMLLDFDTREIRIYNSDSGIFEIAKPTLQRIIVNWSSYFRHGWTAALETITIAILERKLSVMDDPRSFHYFGFANKDLNLKTLAFENHDPTHNLLTGSDIMVDENADAPIFRKVVGEWFKNDPDSIKMLEEFMGYILSDSHQANALLICLGEGSNGKSVFGRILTGLVGLENTSSVPISGFSERFSLEPLLNKRLNIADESRIAELETSKLKSLTSGQQVSVDRKNKPEITAVMAIKQVYMLNQIPPLSDTGYAFQRRLLILDFKHIVAPEEQDRNLDEKLDGELPGILNIAVAGLRRLVSNNFEFTKSANSKAALKRIFSIADPVGDYIDAKIEKKVANKVESNDVFNNFMDWCQETHTPSSMYSSTRKFWPEFREKLLNKLQLNGEKRKSNGHTYIDDITFR